jgi:hypothetical protein
MTTPTLKLSLVIAAGIAVTGCASHYSGQTYSEYSRFDHGHSHDTYIEHRRYQQPHGHQYHYDDRRRHTDSHYNNHPQQLDQRQPQRVKVNYDGRQPSRGDHQQEQGSVERPHNTPPIRDRDRDQMPAQHHIQTDRPKEPSRDHRVNPQPPRYVDQERNRQRPESQNQDNHGKKSQREQGRIPLKYTEPNK